MKKVKHIGDGYHGFDSVNESFIFVRKGESVEVSDVKAEQLLRDFPKEWVIDAPQPSVSVKQEKTVGKK